MRRTDRGVVLGLYRHDPDRSLIEHALRLGVRGLDTAVNYRDFTAQRKLAAVASDLLAEFTVSTKVGFFPGRDGRVDHSLRPERLHGAIAQTAEHLDWTPDVVFLHNPERSLVSLPAGEGNDELAAACAALAGAAASGLCRAWGIASWDPRPLRDVLIAEPLDHQPHVLLVRAGLSVPDVVLTAADTTRAILDVGPDRCWGMSPFGGSTHDPAWRTTNLSAFLAPHERCSTLQAAFRLAYELPSVTRIAVGTSDPTHLTELVAATDVGILGETIDRYRELLHATTPRPT